MTSTVIWIGKDDYQPNMWDMSFLATVQWPKMEAIDYIEPDMSENHLYLLESMQALVSRLLHNDRYNQHHLNLKHNKDNPEHNNQYHYRLCATYY